MGSRVRQLADEALNVTVWSHHEQSVSEHDGSVFISHDQKNTEKKTKNKKTRRRLGKVGLQLKSDVSQQQLITHHFRNEVVVFATGRDWTHPGLGLGMMMMLQ